MPPLARLGQAVLAVLAFLIPARVLLNGADCSWKFWLRADVVTLTVVGFVLAMSLARAIATDGDSARGLGTVAAGAVAGELAGASPLLAIVAVLGLFRAPRSRQLRGVSVIFAGVSAVIAYGAPLVAQRFVPFIQFVCP